MRSALRTRFVFWSLNSEAPHPCTLQYPKRHTSRPLTGRTLREGQRAEERRCSAHSWSPSRPLILKRRGTKEQTPTVGCGASRSRGLVRGRLARAHACGRASTSGSGGDHSMVAKLRRSRCPRCLTQMSHGRSICRKLTAKVRIVLP
jgi:hypothetical protein